MGSDVFRSESPIKRANTAGKARWVARFTGPDGKRRSAGTFATKREAQDAIRAAYAIAPRSTDTLESYASTWTTRRPRSERTNRDRDSKLRAVMDAPVDGQRFGDLALGELRRRHTLELVDHMLRKQKRAATGAANILRVLSALAEDAITDELMDANPFKGVRVRESDPRVVKGRVPKRVWSFEHMHDFAAATGRYEPMVRMLADCGLRLGELLALEADKQDLDAGTFRVTGTAWNGRFIASSREKRHDRIGPIPPGCLEMVRAFKRPESRWLFPTLPSMRVGNAGRDLPGGCLWMESNFRRQVWTPTQLRSGLPMTPHEMRHSYVSNLRAARVDGADLAAIAGHSEAVADGIYRHALGQSFDEIRRLVG